MQICNDKKNKIMVILPYIFLIMVIGVDILFIATRGKYLVDSDIASNLIAADFFNKESVFLSKEWFYSTGLAVSQTQYLRPFMIIFQNNWIGALSCSIFVSLVLIIFVYMFICTNIGFNRSNALWYATFCICPISYWYLLTVTLEGYYGLEIICSYLYIGILIYYVKTETKINSKKNIYLILCAFLSIYCGICGEKYMLFPYAPVCMAAMLLFLFYFRKNSGKVVEEVKKCINLCLFAVLSFGLYFSGYLFNSKVLSKKYVYQNYSNITWYEFSINSLLTSISEYLSLFGFQNNPSVNEMLVTRKSPSLFSIQGIACFFAILIAGYLILSLIRLIIRFDDLSFYYQIIVLIMICTLIIDAIIFRWTEGHDTGIGYWITVVPLGFLIMQIENETEDYKFTYSSKLIVFVLLISIGITSYASISDFQENPINGSKQMANVAEWLSANGYTKGYATFWNSNVVTMLTSGDIEMWTVYGFDNLELNPWLQKKNHMNPPSGDKIFALVGPRDNLDKDIFLQYMNMTPGIPEIVYSDEEGYIVVEYK